MPDFLTMFLNVCSVFVIIATAVFAWRNRSKHACLALFQICIVMIVWACVYTLEAIVGSLQKPVLFYMELFFMLLSIPAVLIFCLRYTGLFRKSERKLIYAVCAVQFAFFILLVTNPLHHLIWAGQTQPKIDQYGELALQGTQLFHFLLSADYLLYAFSLTMLIYFVVHVKGALRGKTMVVIAGLLVFLAYIVLRGTAPQSGVSLLPLTVLLAFSCIMDLIAVLGYDMTSLTPFAYREIFKIMDDGVVVTNQRGEVVDFNPAAARIIEKHGYGRPVDGPKGYRQAGEWIDRFCPKCADTVQQKGVVMERLIDGKPCYYSFDIYPFRNPVNLEIGSFLLIKDVTKQQVYNQFLKRQAEMDGLTGIYNRPAFDEAVTRLMKGCTDPAAILFFDIDLFKNVNDTYGHIFGDTVLQNVAECVTGHLKKDIPFGRVGGEEFAVFLRGPGAQKEVAAATAEKLRAAIEAYPFLCEGSRVRITISVGVACARSLPYSQLYRHADEMLYRAKNGGRNCVAVWQEGEPNQG